MNAHYEMFKKPFVKGSRDPVLLWIVKNVLEPIENPKILTIGAERDMDINSRAGDGWADFYWAELIKSKNRGKLVIVDIDNQAIDNCLKIFQDFIWDIDINFVLADGVNIIEKLPWDFIYLDGSPDPYEMLAQYEKIDRAKSFILIDDYKDKGALISKKYSNDIKVMHVNYCHDMACVPRIGENFDEKLLELDKDLYNNRIA